MKTNDIYRTVDEQLIKKDFWLLSLEEKKQLIEQELRYYILGKLPINKQSLTDEKNLSTIDLLQLFADEIPLEQHNTTLNHFIHYLLKVASNMQGWEIEWLEEQDEELIETPCIEFNEEQLWIRLKTHHNTSYVKAFHFVLDVFKNYFLTEIKPKEKRLFNHEG